jgi:hypothetical protein
MFFNHPDFIEEQAHGRDVAYWAAGVPCATMDEAIRVAGGDTAEDIRREMQWRDEESYIAAQDAMEARGGPEFYVDPLAGDEIPF